MKFHNWADQASNENGELMAGTGGEPIAIGQLRNMSAGKLLFGQIPSDNKSSFILTSLRYTKTMF